jgi:hypothetical protein
MRKLSGPNMSKVSEQVRVLIIKRGNFLISIRHLMFFCEYRHLEYSDKPRNLEPINKRE